MARTEAPGGVRSRPVRDASWFVPLESKLQVPALRPEFVRRAHLVEQLRSAGDSPLILVTAPPGYGKTALLAEWGEEDERPFVWLTLDDSDNDPSRLLSYLVFALSEVLPLGPGLFPRPPEPGPSFTAFALPRLSRVLSKRVRPFVFVIDDVHVLHDRESLDQLAIVVRNLRAHSHLVLAGRDVPQLPLNPLLVSHALLRLGSRQLAMSALEGHQLMHAAGIPLGESEAEMIVGRTEGWPAGLSLAAVALGEQKHLRGALDAFAGSEGLVFDYFREEVLERQSPEELAFMLGTAVLERLSGPLCDAIRGASDSGTRLEETVRANLFIMPIGRNRVWFRRHQLFREMLLAELRRREPQQEAMQHRRASAWYEADGNPDEALEHAHAAGDIRLSAEIIARNLVEYVSTGRAATVRRWIETLPVGELSGLPWFAAAAAMAYASNGDAERAIPWLAAAERGFGDEGALPDGRSSLRSAIAISRALLGAQGIAQLRADAEVGYELEPEGSPWRAVSAFLLGSALQMQGDVEAAVAKLGEAADLSGPEVPDIHAFSLAQLGVAAFEREDWEGVRELGERARLQVERQGLQEYSAASMVYAISSVSCAHWRQPAEARRDAMRASRLLASLSRTMPWKGVQGRVLLANTYLRLGDVGAAREALREARREFRRLHMEDAPALAFHLSQIQRAVDSAVAVTAGPALTAAEIRVAQFLPTHLSFREIAARLHVSRNTVKTQIISAYRKLGVSTRTEAVESASVLGLLEPLPEPVLEEPVLEEPVFERWVSGGSG